MNLVMELIISLFIFIWGTMLLLKWVDPVVYMKELNTFKKFLTKAREFPSISLGEWSLDKRPAGGILLTGWVIYDPATDIFLTLTLKDTADDEEEKYTWRKDPYVLVFDEDGDMVPGHNKAVLWNTCTDGSMMVPCEMLFNFKQILFFQWCTKYITVNYRGETMPVRSHLEEGLLG